MRKSKVVSLLCIFEDDRFANFFPLSLSQPVFELAIGTHTLRSRLVEEIGPEAVLLVCRPYLSAVIAVEKAAKGDHPMYVNSIPAESEVLFLNGRILAYGSELRDLLASLNKGEIAAKGGTVVAAKLDRSKAEAFVAFISSLISDDCMERAVKEVRAHSYADSASSRKSLQGKDISRVKALSKWAAQNSLPIKETNTRLVSHYWQLIGENRACIIDDFQKSPLRGASPETELFKGVELINEADIVIGSEVEVRSGTVLDASDGAIMIENEVRIEPNAIIYGPCAIGKGSIVRGGAKIGHGTTLGRYCRIGGEVEESIFAGYSNKQHEGFVGHSYVGCWVNMGAGSCTSDLKNNYGSVKAWSAGGIRDTGRMFLGATIADHAKISIGSRLPTGAVVGFNSNVICSGFAPRFVPSFAWKVEPQLVLWKLEEAVETARRMMDRRNVSLSAAHEELFGSIYRFCRLSDGTL